MAAGVTDDVALFGRSAADAIIAGAAKYFVGVFLRGAFNQQRLPRANHRLTRRDHLLIADRL